MPIYLSPDTRAALGGAGLPHCQSRSLWKDKFLLFDAAFDESKLVALDLYMPRGRQDIASLRAGWESERQKQAQKQAVAQANNRPFNRAALNKATAALAATQSVAQTAPKPVARLRQWLSALPAHRTHIFSLQTASRLLVGLANGALENAGCTLHTLFGFPIVPASALKAVARDEAAARGITNTDMLRIFGGLPGDDENTSQGSISFLDAHALLAPEQVDLEVDVVTPHFRNYYAGTGNADARDEEPPMPSPFAAVASGVVFEFALIAHTCRLSDQQAAHDLKTAAECLTTALCTAGVGAKTAAGYGRFVFTEAAGQLQIRQDLFPPPPRPVLPVHEEVLAAWQGRQISTFVFKTLIPDLSRIEDAEQLATVFDALFPANERINFRSANPYWARFRADGGDAILARMNRPLPRQ